MRRMHAFEQLRLDERRCGVPRKVAVFEVFRAQSLAHIIQAYRAGDVAVLTELLEELTKHLTWGRHEEDSWEVQQCLREELGRGVLFYLRLQQGP